MAITDAYTETSPQEVPPSPEAFLITELTEEERLLREEQQRILAAYEVRMVEERFYRQGVADWVAGRKDTDAAKYYYDYWVSR